MAKKKFTVEQKDVIDRHLDVIEAMEEEYNSTSDAIKVGNLQRCIRLLRILQDMGYIYEGTGPLATHARHKGNIPNPPAARKARVEAKPAVVEVTPQDPGSFEGESEGTIDSPATPGDSPKDQAEDLVVVCGVFIHPAAEDNKKIYDYNYQATKDAIASAMSGKPSVDEMLAGKDEAEHPFRGF